MPGPGTRNPASGQKTADGAAKERRREARRRYGREREGTERKANDKKRGTSTGTGRQGDSGSRKQGDVEIVGAGRGGDTA